MRNALKNVVATTVAVLLMCSFALAEDVTGIVTNKTNNKPAAGDDVVLLQLAQGMQELARTKTDSKGKFTISVPADGLHLLRVTHDKANYFKPIQPGTQSVDVEVYTAAANVEGVSLDADVMRLETEAGGGSLKVTEHFFVKNDSHPLKTLMSDHPFELYLPAGAQVQGVAAKAPNGMAVQQALVPETEANKFTLLFPLRPGSTEFQVTYKLPYSPDKGYNFQPRPTMPTDTIALMMPKAMTFKAGQSTPYTAVTDEDITAQTYVARNVQPSQPLQFTVTGAGQLPRDTGAGNQGTTAAGSGGNHRRGLGRSQHRHPAPAAASACPVDKDAEREGVDLQVQAGGSSPASASSSPPPQGFLLKGPSRPLAAPVRPGQAPCRRCATSSSPSKPTASPAGSLKPNTPSSKAHSISCSNASSAGRTSPQPASTSPATNSDTDELESDVL